MRGSGVWIGVAAALAWMVPGAARGEPCGTVTDVGCCGQNIVKYCDGGSLVTVDCKKKGPADEKVCGWWPDFGYYDCGGVGGEPTGKYPYLCPGEACTPTCENKECGSDGCHGVCGECTDGKLCNKDFKCEALPPCNGIPYEGCCLDAIQQWCEKGYLHQFDCGTNTCGWKGTEGNGVYECGYKNEDPSGTFPRDCNAYLPKPDEVEAAEPVPDETPAEPTPEAVEDVPAANDPGTADTGAIDPGVSVDVAKPDVPVKDIPDTRTTPVPASSKSCTAGTAGGAATLLPLLLPVLALRRRRAR